MWDETLIESMGRRNNGKRWVTVQIAAIVHAGVVAILAAASFWYADVMKLPVRSQSITDVFFSESLPSSPVAFGIRRPVSQEKPVLNNQIPKQPETITQDRLVPEQPNFVEASTPWSDPGNIGDMPEGDPKGVRGGIPNGSENGFGPGGNGIPGDQPVAEGEFRRLGVEQPVLIQRIQPDYPKIALAAHIQGTVVLQALIARNGAVQNVTIMRGAHPLLNQSAIEAVSHWKYKPATLGGKPIAVYFQVTVMFTIR